MILKSGVWDYDGEFAPYWLRHGLHCTTSAFNVDLSRFAQH